MGKLDGKVIELASVSDLNTSLKDLAGSWKKASDLNDQYNPLRQKFQVAIADLRESIRKAENIKKEFEKSAQDLGIKPETVKEYNDMVTQLANDNRSLKMFDSYFN